MNEILEASDRGFRDRVIFKVESLYSLGKWTSEREGLEIVFEAILSMLELDMSKAILILEISLSICFMFLNPNRVLINITPSDSRLMTNII